MASADRAGLAQQAPTQFCSSMTVATQAHYMDGLCPSFADLTDATLRVDGARLPVHSAILAANSQVFAELFIAARADANESKASQLKVSLLGDKMWVVLYCLEVSLPRMHSVQC